MKNKDYKSQRREKNILKDKKKLSLDFTAKKESDGILEDFRICEGCRFFNVFSEEFGSCHRNAPFPFIQPFEDKEIYPNVVIWPFVNKDNWCGEWRAI